MKRVGAGSVFCALLMACSTSPEASRAPAASGEKTTASAERTTKQKVDKHPWASFKVGSFVQMKTDTAMEVAGHKTQNSTEMKMTLVDLTPNKATVETEMTVMGHTTKTKVDLPLAGPVSSSSAPSAPPLKSGTETLTVAGKSLACKWTEVENEASGTKAVVKAWTSDEVPGFLVKSVTTTKGGANTQTTTEVVNYKAN